LVAIGLVIVDEALLAIKFGLGWQFGHRGAAADSGDLGESIRLGLIPPRSLERGV